MSIPQKWKYVYWFVAFSIFSILIEVFRLFEGSTTTIVVAVVTIFCFSWLSTYIYGKIPWLITSIVHIDVEEATSSSEETNSC